MVTRRNRLPETTCPQCGSASIRPAHNRSLLERVFSFLGFYPGRCQDCAHRFLARPFTFDKVIWSKCPRCYRMDLSTWDPKYYHVPAWSRVRLLFGAHRWRCEACRCNFVSFRPRQRNYIKPAPPTGVTATGENDDAGGTPEPASHRQKNGSK